MKVVVNPVQTINVKVNQQNPQVVHGTSTFIGASSQEAQIQGAFNAANSAVSAAAAATLAANNAYNASNISYAAANTALTQVGNAYNEANLAYASANTKFSANGGLISGNVTITGSIVPTSSNTFTLGTANTPWKSLYVSSGTVYIDNIALSNSNNSLTISNSSSFIVPSINISGDIISNGIFYGVISQVDGGTFS
jgi:hypothetical protein